MPVLFTVREESSGVASVDYVKTGRDNRVVLVDFRDLYRANNPIDIAVVARQVRSLPATNPWRAAILEELTTLLERCRQNLANRKNDDGPFDLPDAG